MIESLISESDCHKNHFLIQQTKSLYHKFTQVKKDLQTRNEAVDFSESISKDADIRFSVGQGTQFKVLVAEAQLVRDKQLQSEKETQLEIIKIQLKELLNMDISINETQKLIGFWNYSGFCNLETKIAYLNLISNINKIKFAKEEIELLNESLRLSKLRYEAGITILSEVIMNQNQLTQAKLKLSQAIYNYNLTLEELERLTSLNIDSECKNESFCDVVSDKEISFPIREGGRTVGAGVVSKIIE